MVPSFIACFFKTPIWIVWLFLLVGLVLPLFPYFRAIDYPLSLALTILAACAAPLWGRFSLPEVDGVAKAVGRVAGLSLLAVAAGAIPAGVASAFTDVCEPDYGLLFLLMGPVSTTFVGGLVGLGLARLQVGWKGSVAILAGLVLGSWLLVLGELLWSPGVRFYGTFFGLYHGAIYDEGVFVDAPYFWLRFKDLVFVLAGVSYFWGRGSTGLVRRKAFLVPLLGMVILMGLGPKLGFVSTAFPLESELSLQVQLDGVVLRVTPGGRAEKRLKRLADEVQFRRHQVMELFELSPDEVPEVTVFVYDSPWQKERLMGAHRTSITKPWRNEIHIHAHETPNSLVAHELVHALLSEIPDSPLGIPARLWLLPEAGIIEGAAVSVERASGRYTTHEWARAVRDLGLRPPLSNLMKGMAFWSYPGPVAYNTCGSFVRFLLERYGGSSFKKVYGGASWMEAYGKSLETLAAEWDEYLDQLEVDAGAMEYARFLFAQKSVFERACPYVGGRCLKRAYMAASSNDLPAFLGAAKMGLRATNEEPKLARTFVDLAIIVGEMELARDLWVAAFLRKPTCDSVSGPWSLVDCRFSQALGAVVLMRWGDLLWLAGENGKAKEVYETLWDGESRQVLEHVLPWRLQLVSHGDLDEDSRRLVCGLWHPRESDGFFKRLLERTGQGQGPAPLRVLLGLTLLKRPYWTVQGLSLLSYVDLDKAMPETQRVDVLLEVAYGHYFAGDLKGVGEYLGQCGRLKTTRIQAEGIADLAQRNRWHTSGVSLHPSSPVVENQE